MIIISELKHNRFAHVDVPTGADLFVRVGPRDAAKSQFSGEEYINPSVTKIEAAKDVLDNDTE